MQFPSLIKNALVFVTVSAAAVACGSPASETTAPTTVSVAEPLTIEASEATRSAIGVMAWGMGVDDRGDVLVRGYTASGKPAVEIHHVSTVEDGGHNTIEITVGGASGAAVMRQQVERAPAAEGKVAVTVKTVQNTFSDSPGARAVLERFAADQTASKAKESGPRGGLIGGASLHPSDIELVKGVCVDLKVTCMAKLTVTAAGLVASATGCSLTVADTAIALICSIATAETGAGPVACVAALGPKIGAEAAACAIGVAQTIDSGKDIKAECTKKCAAAK